jgi:multiple sugar transport system permease protein
MTTTTLRTGAAGRRHGRRRVTTHVLLVLAALVMLYPLLWMLASSLKPENQIFTETGLLPHDPQWGNYLRGWKGFGVSFDVFFENSLFLALANVLGNTASCALAAYAFARLDFPLKRLWFGAMLATLMLPAHVTLIPQYTLFNALGWVNTFYPLFVPHFLATDAFFVFLMVQFIRGLPRELDESARLDGCGPVRTFRSIILPLLVPALVTTGIFSFIW